MFISNQINKRKLQAFSLVELSIVLVIISIALGFGLSYAAKKTDYDRIEETKQKIKDLEMAIYSYIANNRSLPCPADPQLAEIDNNFGVAQRAVTPYFCIQSPVFPGLRSNNMVWGAIPTSSLSIKDELAYDAWGKLFSYIMIEQCNANESLDPTNNFSNSAICGGSAPTQITINDASGSLLMSNAVFVIISHGKNGYGAFVGNGSDRRQISATVVGTQEQENAHLDNSSPTGTDILPVINQVFVARSPNITAPGTDYFDDIVFFKNQRQLIAGAYGIYNQQNSVCNMITNIGNNLILVEELCGSKTTPNCITIFNSLIIDTLGKFCY